MSFPGWPGVAPPMSIAPPPSILAMRGPMARVTTTRHDYTAKGAEKPAIIVPEGEIKISCKPLEGESGVGGLEAQAEGKASLPAARPGRQPGPLQDSRAHPVAYPEFRRRSWRRASALAENRSLSRRFKGTNAAPL